MFASKVSTARKVGGKLLRHGPARGQALQSMRCMSVWNVNDDKTASDHSPAVQYRPYYGGDNYYNHSSSSHPSYMTRGFATLADADTDGEEENTPQVVVEFHDDNDGKVTVVTVDAGTKITEAATKADVYIPTLCHHPRLSPAGKCGVCVCGVENGPTPTQLACTSACRPNDDGSPIKVHVHGTLLNGLANSALKRNLEQSIDHKTKRFKKGADFAPRGSSEIENVVGWLSSENIDTSSKSITYDPSLCVGCDRCIRACNDVQGMGVLESSMPTSSKPTVGVASAPACMTTKAGRPLSQTDCISCGQCTSFCPTGAIKEVDHTASVMQALSDPKKTVVLHTAPSVRVTLGEAFGGAPGDCSAEKLVGAAKMCGFDYVFDTNFTADLTILEEANELLKRIQVAQTGTEEEKAKMPLPMFTSCCPGWINLVEQSYPEFIPHLSSCRSPMGMLSSLIRHYWWPKQNQVNPKDAAAVTEVDQSNLYVVSVMPCTAKKDEMSRQQLGLDNGRQETDAVLTVREMARLLELRGVAGRENFQSFQDIPELPYDNPLGESTGAAVIFGATGGVMEAALRTAADVLSGQDLQEVKYQEVRGLEGIKESTVQLGKDKGISLNVAVANQMKHVREFLDQVKEGEKDYHFIEIMTCPGGCIGGGGLPQSRDPEILEKRTQSIYALDEKMVKRKSHDNESVKRLYEEFLGEPLSHLSHELLHTHYEARPRKIPVLLKAPESSSGSLDLDSGDDANNIYIVYGTQSGTASQAAKDIKMELQLTIGRSKLNPEPQVCLVAANSMPPESLVERVRGSMASIFVTCTYGEGEMPSMVNKLWQHLQDSGNDGILSESETKYAVFGLCSSRYDVGDQYNRAARQIDERLANMGGSPLVDVGIGDDQSSEGYRGALDPWLQQLQSNLFAGGAAKSSLLNPPEPLFRISLAPGVHGTHFRPLPPGYNFITLKSTKSLVSKGYNRPAGLFSFSLEDTGVEYKVGDHLSILPRNPKPVVDYILDMYSGALSGSQLITVEAIDPYGDCPYPKVLSIEELVTQYLDLCGRPSRSFFKQLSMFATSDETRKALRAMSERDTEYSIPQEEFDAYTNQNTYADVLAEFKGTCLPPFEYLLSMVPNVTPRYYSIASSPLANESQLDLLVVLNDWKDSAKKKRFGLNTQYLFRAEPGSKFAVQVHEGMLIPPGLDDLDTPVVMFSLGAGLAPFVGFVQHREALLKQLNEQKANGDGPKKMGPATLYFGSRHRAHEYYMEEYFEKMIQEGALTAIHTAFSRDDPTGKKHYVYDAISDNPRAFAEALQIQDKEKAEKAQCYYCGSANGIPEAIQASMKRALISKDGAYMTEEEAQEYMDRLVNKDHRFNAECF